MYNTLLILKTSSSLLLKFEGVKATVSPDSHPSNFPRTNTLFEPAFEF